MLARQSPPPHHAGRRSQLRRTRQGELSQGQARRGALRAALVSAYHMLAKGLAYRDLAAVYLDQIGQRLLYSSILPLYRQGKYKRSLRTNRRTHRRGAPAAPKPPAGRGDAETKKGLYG